MRILGQEFAGEVEALGDGVTSFALGDRVYGTTGIGLGAYAEYVCAGGRRVGSVVVLTPAAMSYAEAAAVPYGAMEALRFLRKGDIGAGQRVLYRRRRRQLRHLRGPTGEACRRRGGRRRQHR